jgi:GNAT superfamily N-acetyltransferase
VCPVKVTGMVSFATEAFVNPRMWLRKMSSSSIREGLDLIQVSDLRLAPHLIFTIAQWHFEHWGPLTGAESLDCYAKVLANATTCELLPRVLIAEKDGRLLGSVNLVACDCQIYPDLTPWLAQLFVTPNERTLGVGRALVQAAEREARVLGFSTLYLFTSGTLPSYYRRQGWLSSARFDYLGTERILMQRDLREMESTPDPHDGRATCAS